MSENNNFCRFPLYKNFSRENIFLFSIIQRQNKEVQDILNIPYENLKPKRSREINTGAKSHFLPIKSLNLIFEIT